MCVEQEMGNTNLDELSLSRPDTGGLCVVPTKGSYPVICRPFNFLLRNHWKTEEIIKGLADKRVLLLSSLKVRRRPGPMHGRASKKRLLTR